MSDPQIEIHTVRAHGPDERRVVDIDVIHRGTVHRIGWLPSQGWFCGCQRARRCPHIDLVRPLVPALDRQETPAHG